MARLIRTEKEVEGRYEDVWLVVDEDALDQWPPGPQEIVGRPATRVTGPLRARGEARYTADLRLPGMLHTAVLRCPHAYARVRKIDFERALAAPGVRAAIGPGDAHMLTAEPGYQGEPVAAVAADTFGQARAALALVDVDWEVREPLTDPDEAVRRGQLVGEESRYERGDVDKALAAPGVRAAIGPGDADMLTDEPGFQGQAVVAVAAETYGQARAALELVEVDWEVL